MNSIDCASQISESVMETLKVNSIGIVWGISQP